MIDKTGKKCQFSRLPIENHEFSLRAPVFWFSENGLGYTLFFKMNIFAIFNTLIAMTPLAVFLILLFLTGHDCKEKVPESVKDTHKSLATSALSHHDNRWMGYDFGALHETQSTLLKATGKLVAHSQDQGDAEDDDDDPLNLKKEDKSGAGSVFRSIIAFCTNDYLHETFQRICFDQPKPLAEQRNILPEYRRFCKGYHQDGCLSKTSRVCSQHALQFYQRMNVVDSCEYNILNRISISNRANIEERSTSTDLLLPLIYILLLIFMNVFALGFQWWHHEYQRVLEKKTVEIGDIHVLIKNLPYGKGFDGQEIKQGIVDMFYEAGLEVVRVNFVFEVNKYQKLIDNIRQEVEDEAKKIYKRQRKALKPPKNGDLGTAGVETNLEDSKLLEADREHEEKIRDLNQQVLDYEFRYDQLDAELMVGRAFVGFRTTDQKFDCLERFERDTVSKKLTQFFRSSFLDNLILKLKNGTYTREVLVEDADEPKDIIWEHLKYSRFNISCRKLISFLLAGFIVFGSFWLLYHVQTYSVSLAQKPIFPSFFPLFPVFFIHFFFGF